MKLTQCLTLLIATWLIAGCATHPTQVINNAVSDPSQLRNWSVQGRIGITGVAQGGSGSFSWQQHDAVSSINLHGPLGAGAIAITLDDTLHITTANGAHYDADAALTELETRLGTTVPVKQLSYWLRGVPANGEYQWFNEGDKKSIATGRVAH